MFLCHKSVLCTSGSRLPCGVCVQQLHKRRHFAALCFCQEEPCLGLLELYVLLCDEECLGSQRIKCACACLF